MVELLVSKYKLVLIKPLADKQALNSKIPFFRNSHFQKYVENMNFIAKCLELPPNNHSITPQQVLLV